MHLADAFIQSEIQSIALAVQKVVGSIPREHTYW